MALLLTDDESVLECLSRQPLPLGIIGGSFPAFWQAAWETRAQDWKAPWARRLAWQTLLQTPYREDDNLRLFRRVLHRERDWYVLHTLASWIPYGEPQRQQLGAIWRECLGSRYPALRLLARDALMNLGMNPGLPGEMSPELF